MEMDFRTLRYGWRRVKRVKRRLKEMFNDMPIGMWWDFLWDLEKLADKYEALLEEEKKKEEK